MSEILLINPPLLEDTGLDIRMNPPLGILYIAGVLRKAGYDCKAIDMNAENHLWYNVRERLTIENPKHVLVTATSLSYPSLVKTVKICKDIEKLVGHKIHTVIGGAHCSSTPELSLKESGADCCVVGEGELVIEDVVKNDITGIIKGNVINNLDNYEVAWDLLEPRIGTLPQDNNGVGYTGNEPILALPEADMLWSRGCPSSCVFCANSIFKRPQIRFRSKENICNELELLRNKYGIRGIFEYSDELVGMNLRQSKWLEEVCDEIIKRGLNDITYKCQGRCNSKVITPKLLNTMKDAGFQAIMWGIESGSQKVLDAVKKDTTIDNIEKTIKMSYDAGIKVWAFLMVGNVSNTYCETEEDAQMTFDLVKRNKKYISFRHCTVATPYVGSELWNIANKNNWIVDKDYGHWNAHKPPLDCPDFPRDRIEYWVNQILNI